MTTKFWIAFVSLAGLLALVAGVDPALAQESATAATDAAAASDAPSILVPAPDARADNILSLLFFITVLGIVWAAGAAGGYIRFLHDTVDGHTLAPEALAWRRQQFMTSGAMAALLVPVVLTLWEAVFASRNTGIMHDIFNAAQDTATDWLLLIGLCGIAGVAGRSLVQGISQNFSSSKDVQNDPLYSMN
ncbi:MAG: YEATS-associated helix-containing protein [Alphaproteobacteria bacterium]